MDRRRAAGLLLALAACFATATAAPTASNHTALDLYDGAPEGCYYNFQHYGEGDRIMTNEPCLNCTCHNRMLMCYLRVCPFTKPIGQDCTIEKRADQCCPIVTCPDVPVDLLTSTTTSPAEYGPTGVGKLDKFGCSINGKYFSEGSKVPPTPNKPCEHCYCIRNMTTCVMQECTLHVDGCTPIYHKDVCCPVRYSCDHPEDEMPLLDDMSTTVRPTPGFLLTTTTISPVTQMSQDCVYDNRIFPDGALIKTEKACDHCYCMKGDIVCVVQECGTPMENEGKNCTALPPREGVCCPDTYICEGDEPTTGTYDLDEGTTISTDQEKLTTLTPPRRTSSEGSGYRNEPDDVPYTESPIVEPEMEGSGEETPEKVLTETPKPDVTSDILASTEETHEFIPLTTTKPKEQDETKTEITKEDVDLINIENTEKTTESQQRLPTTSSYYNTNDAAQPTTDKIEDIGSGEQPEDDLRQHEIATVAPVFDDIKENVATTKPYNHEDMPSQGTEKETLEPQEMVTAVPKEDTSHKPSDLDASIEDNRDLTSTDTIGDHEATSPIVSDHEHSTLSLDTIDVTKVPKQTTVKSFEPSDVTTLHTPIIEEDAKVTSKPAEQDLVTGAPDHSIEEVKLQTSTIVPSIEDEFITTESQPVETDIVKESHHIEPQLVTASTPMLEEIERDTTEYTESGHVPSGATRDDMFDILSSTATSLLGIEDAKKPEVFQPITTNIPVLDQQEEITVGYEKITEAPVDNNIKESSKPEGHPSSTITPDFLDTELKTTVSPAIAESEYEGDKQESDEGTISSVNEIVEATTEPDKGLNTIPSEESPDLQKHTTTEEKITTAADIVDRFSTESEDSVTTTLPLITEDDQSLLTTESAFRKEDYSPTEAEISHKPTTVTADITEEVISTLTHDHTKITESVTDMQLQTSTSSAPKFTQNLDDATLAEKISTDSSYDISTSEVSISDITTEKPSSSSVDMETTIANEEDNEIFNEPRIPGEGDCLLNGITYTNESVVPSTNKCQSGCKCVSSIIKCDPIICSPPPEYMNNCETTYDTPDACCPTFICDHKTETMPPQSHSQMSGTETPVISPVQCHDGKCEISKDQKHQTEVSEACKSGNCSGPSEGYDKTTDQSETIPAKPITTQNQECVGEECKQILCSDEHGCQATPVQPCEGEKCETSSEGSTGLETQLCTNSQDCAVPSAPTQECNGNNCNVSDKKPEIHTSGPCAGEEGCLDISGVLEDKCEGSHCRRKDDSSIEQEIITKQPEISQAEHLTTVYATDEDATKSKPEEVTKASSLMDNAGIVTNAFVTDGQSLEVTEPSKTHTPGLQDITESDQKIKPDTEITSSTVTQPSVTIPEEVTGISQEIEPSKPTDGSNADDKLTDNIMIPESTTDDNFSDFVTESSKPFSAEPFITTISSEDDKTSEIFQSTEMPLSYTTKSQDGSKSSEVSRTTTERETTENIGDISSEEHLITLKPTPDVPFIDPKLPEVITTDQQDVLSESDEMTTQLTEIVSTHDYPFDQEIKTEYPEINYTPQQEQSTIITEKPVIPVEGSTNIPTVVKDTMNINEVESETKPGYDSTKLYDDNTVRPLYQDSKEDEKPINDLIQSIVTDKYEDETKPSSEDNFPTDLPALITSRPENEIKQHEHVQEESTTPISIQSETTAKEYDVNDMVSTEYDKPVEKEIITETPADIKETENEIATEKPSAIDIITKPTTQDTLLTEIDSSDKLLDDLNEKSTQSYSTDIPEKQTQYVPVITEVPYIPTRPETLETIAAELPEISSDKPEPTSKPISEDVTQRVSEVFEPGKIQPESTTIEPSSDITLPLELPTVTGRPLEDSEGPTSGESEFTDEIKEEPSGVTTDKQLEPEIYQTTSPNVQIIEMSTRPSASVDESSTTLIHDIIEQKPPTEEQSIPVVIAEKDTTSPPEESIADQTEKIASVSEEPIQDTIAPEEELIIATSQRTTSKDEKETSTFSPTADQSGQPTTPGSYNIDSSEVPAPESPVTTEPEEQTTKISKEPVTSIPDESTSSTPVSPIRITKAPEESIISATATSILDSSEKSTVNESEAPTTNKFEEPITKTPEVPISSETKEPIPSDIEEPITSIPKELFTNAPREPITEDYVTSIPQKLSTSAPEAQTSGIPAKPITRTPEESVTSASEAPITNAPVEVINGTPEEHVSSEPEALATRAPQEIISSEPEVPATKAPVEHISIEPEAPSSKEPEEHISSEPEAPSTKAPEEYVHSEPATPATRAPEEIIPSELETSATKAPEEPISSEPEISTTKVPEEPISSELDATSTSATKEPILSELDAPSIRIPEEPISSDTEAPHTKGPEESISSEPETLASIAPEETIDSKSEASTTRAPEENIPIEPQSPATGAPEETNASEPEMPATKAPEQSIINEPEILATRTPDEQTSSEPEAPATKTPEEIISSKPEAPATRAPEEPISSEPEAPATAAPEEPISSEPETPATKTPEESISSKPEAPATRAPEEPISSEPEAPATAAPEEPISNEPETPATKTPEESIFRETEAPYTKKPAEPIPSESEAPATRAPEEPIPSEPEAAATKAPEEHIPSESEVPATRAPEEPIPSEPEAPATKAPEEHIPTEPESPATRAPEETIPSEPEVPATSAPEEDIPIEPESPATKAPEETIASEPETPATKAPEQSIINEPVTSATRAPEEQISSEPEAPGTRAPEGLISSETEAPYTREPAESIPSESEAHATKAPEEAISSEPESPATRAPEESISSATELPATWAPEEHIPSEPESPATRAPEEPMPSEPEVPATSAPEEHIPNESEATATKAPENPISSEPEAPATSTPEEPISSATELPATRAPEEHIPSEPESPVTRAPEETIPSEPESLATRAPEELMPSEPEVPATSAPEEHIPSESEAPATRKPEEHISSESEAPATKAPEELISSETEAPYTRKPAEHIPSEPEAPATKAPEEHIPSEPEASTTSAPEKIIPNEPEAPSTRAPEEIISSEPEVPATRAPEETIPSESEASATRGPEEIIPSEPEAPATRAPEEHIASEPESPPTRAPEEITPSEPEVPATRAPEEHIPSEPEAPSTRTPEERIPSETETPVTRAPEEIIPSEPEAPATRAPEEIIPSEPEAPSTRAPAEVIPSEPEAPATKTPEEIIPSEPEAPVTRAPEEQIPSEPEVPATRAPEEPIHSEPETPTTTAPEAPVTVHEEPINIGPEEGITSAHEASSTTAPEAITKVPKVPISSAPETPVTTAPEIPKPVSTEAQPTDDGLTPDEDGSFPSSGGTSGYGHEPDYMEEDQTFGPGTCRYGGKVYVSAQQIPRDDPCDFCFCFRSDIICLQQSCPPPIHGCHEEPIQGFCCPRYECPVSMATTVNVTTTTTTTTTTLPPHFPTHSYKGSVQKRGCQIKGQTYKVGEVVRASSGPCLHCTCGGDGQMKCDPKVCTPEPMLRQMIAAAVSAKRRR